MKEEIHKSKMVRNIIIGIGIVIVVLGILRIGISVGERRARFVGQFGDNFERNFVGPMGRRGVGGFLDEGLPGGHGAAGQIVSINLPQIVVTGPDNLEKIVAVGTSTVIRQFQQNIQSTDLKVGDSVVVLGSPDNSGVIDAKLIRIMPAPSMPMMNPANNN
jgi:hypothetical protein